MTETSQYVRFPAIRCWIKHILDANYNEIENVFHSIFGKIKRVRFLATIRDKYEFPSFDSETSSNLNLDLDDGTGLIRSSKWKVGPEEIGRYEIGNLAYFIGVLQSREGITSLRIEIIKIISDPNDILLHDAIIIKKIRSGEVVEIPKKTQKFNEIGDEFGEYNDTSIISPEISQQELDDNKTEDSIKEMIFSIIKENSHNGKDTHLKELKIKMQITENKLIRYIRDLEQASKIYMSDENVYQSYD
ncbi:MAG: hypothetical protein KGD73_01200 [Candidatus Lokiarchaeota archaeon]|nr:hypothetical protein [Candidatus Lokiarchaeota archaeon]